VRERPDRGRHALRFGCERRVQGRSRCRANGVFQNPIGLLADFDKVAVRMVVFVDAEHELEARGILDREFDVGNALLVQAPGGVGSAARVRFGKRLHKVAISEPCDFRQQPDRVAKMMGRSPWRNAGAPRRLAQREPIDAALLNDLLRNQEQLLAQIAVMI